jgi:hypothetical protein
VAPPVQRPSARPQAVSFAPLPRRQAVAPRPSSKPLKADYACIFLPDFFALITILTPAAPVYSKAILAEIE